MTRSGTLKSRIQPAKKQRDRSPRPVAKKLPNTVPGRSTHHDQEHRSILFAIESTILRCYIDDERIDDATVLSVLRALMRRDPPGMLPHAWLYSELVVARKVLMDSDPTLDETTWTGCVREVMDSIRRKSGLHVGETQFLELAAEFVAA